MALYDVSTSEKKASPELVAGGTLYSANPVGTILPFGGSSIPSGYLLCDGSAVSRTTYAELYAVIGTSFGTGDGSTTFNLPDMREAVPKGAGLTGHTVGAHVSANGLSVGQFVDDRVQVHSHRYATNTSLTSGSSNQFIESSGGTGFVSNSTMIDARTGATTEVKSVGVNYIIKAKQTVVPADFLSKVDEAVDEVVEQIHNNLYTLISTTVTTTATDYTLVLDRKLSDYDYLIIQQYDSTSMRSSATIHLNQFKNKRVILTALHGTNSSSASDYSASTINIQYIDDTTVNAYATGSAIINTLEIVGVKITK